MALIDAQAWRLRRMGATYVEIATECRCSVTEARAAVARAADDCETDPEMVAIKLDIERMTECLAGVYVAACEGNATAVDRVLRLTERLTALRDRLMSVGGAQVGDVYDVEIP